MLNAIVKLIAYNKINLFLLSLIITIGILFFGYFVVYSLVLLKINLIILGIAILELILSIFSISLVFKITEK